ncbi:hypothetical protein GCM10023310_29390 [Paenibacillus vulneris]
MPQKMMDGKLVSFERKWESKINFSQRNDILIRAGLDILYCKGLHSAIFIIRIGNAA